MLICDEAPFDSALQIDQLGCVVDESDVEVRAFGLLTDFTTALVPGSKRCWCGERGSLNARTLDGEIQREGAQVVGDVGAAEIAYDVPCRRHHREGTTRHVADRRPERPSARA